MIFSRWCPPVLPETPPRREGLASVPDEADVLIASR
jgi:hypothetical protein